MSSNIRTRGEEVYQCDVCGRRTRIPANKYGLNAIQRCIITSGCVGKLHLERNRQEINKTPAFPIAVDGLRDWFQRKILYTHQQPVESDVWIINHELGNRPVIQLYVNTVIDGTTVLTETLPLTTTVIDLNTIEISLSARQSGVAQCISLSSENLINPQFVAPIVDTKAFQITNRGEVSIATLDASPTISLSLSYQQSDTNTEVTVPYTNIDNVASLESPWVGARKVYIAGRTYTVRSFNVITTPSAVTFFEQGLIRDGSMFRFVVADMTPGKNFLLWGTPPYTTVDRLYDRSIDISRLTTSANIFYSKGEIFVDPIYIKSLYPHITVVD